MSKNPKTQFTNPEILENILESDQNYQKSKTRSLNNFIQSYTENEINLQQNNLEINNKPFNFTNLWDSFFQNKLLKLAGTSFVIFCVMFTTIFTGVLVYSQALPENQTSLEAKIKENAQGTKDCKELKVEHKGELNIDKINLNKEFEGKNFDYNTLRVVEKKNIEEGQNEKLDQKEFRLRQYDFSITCEGIYQNWTEFYDQHINIKPPQALEYLKCFVKRAWKWHQDQREVHCPSVDNQNKVSQIHLDDVPFLSNEFRSKIQKDKIFQIESDRPENKYFRASNTFIYFLDENNVLYSMMLYEENAEYFARNYNLIISFE